jgi:hypothetical protein
MPREAPPGVISVPVLGVQGEGRLAPEYFYREAVPPPEVLQPPAPPFDPEVAPGLAPGITPEVRPPDTGPPA